MDALNTILRTEFIERIAFMEHPDAETLRAIKAAGFRFTGVYWERSHAITSTLSKGQLEAITKP